MWQKGLLHQPGFCSGSFWRVNSEGGFVEARVWVVTRHTKWQSLKVTLTQRHLILQRNQRGPWTTWRTVSPLCRTRVDRGYCISMKNIKNKDDVNIIMLERWSAWLPWQSFSYLMEQRMRNITDVHHNNDDDDGLYSIPKILWNLCDKC